MSRKVDGFAGFAAWFVPAMRDALVASGNELVGGIEARLNVPVERDFAGNAVVRSKPGEPPRKDTGELQGNIQSAVTAEPNMLILTVAADRPSTPDVPRELEDELHRPFMSTSRDEAGAIVADHIQKIE